MPEPSLSALIGAQREGVDAVTSVAARFADADWSRPSPCTEWSATDLAAHLRATAVRYGALLAEADAGRVTDVAVLQDLAVRNAAAIAALPPASGPEHIEVFAAQAVRLAERVPGAEGTVVQRWRDGTTLSGRHLAAVAVVEWHVHAWDLARAIGVDYAPRDPLVVADAWRASIRHIELPGGEPWRAVIVASGRRPG